METRPYSRELFIINYRGLVGLDESSLSPLRPSVQSWNGRWSIFLDPTRPDPHFGADEWPVTRPVPAQGQYGDKQSLDFFTYNDTVIWLMC